MSYEGLKDKDLDLKLRLMHYFWRLGYFVRPNIPLYRYRKGERTTRLFTDIDVLAIQLLPLCDPIISVCSAKTGKEGDPAQVFWLAGVMKYFEATNAYYIRSKAGTEAVKQIAKKLRIMPLNEDEFKTLELNLGIDAKRIPFMFTQKCFEETNSFFKIVKLRKRSIHNYLAERYWIDAPNYQLMRILSCAQDLARLNIQKDCKLFMRYYCASLFSVSMVRMLNSVITSPTNMMRERLETELMGGEVAQIEKAKILHSVELLMRDFARYMGAIKSIPPRFIDFSRLIKIDYLEDLLDLVLRFKQCFEEAVIVPRIMDVITFERVLPKRSTSFEKIFENLPALAKTYETNAAKLSKDVLVFLERCRVFRRNEIQPLLELFPES